MPFVKLYSAAFIGLEALLVEVEIDLSQKEGSMRIVGLPDAAVKESKDRVLCAVKNSGFETDCINCMVHLAPAEIKKVGAFYDLPIALGMLSGLGAFPSTELNQYLVGGELGLTGEIRPICGALSLSLLAKKLGKKGVVVPKANAHEAAWVEGIQVIALENLSEGIAFFKSGILINQPLAKMEFKPKISSVDMGEIKGQCHAKRALEIAAAGKHNVLMSGPPGTGKTMLSKAFVGILPPLSFEEAIEVTNLYSLAGMGSGLIQTRPFRSPHHTISFVGMVGGGTHPKPGEISLANKGVLFLDELPEFSRATLEVLRQPLEDKEITVSRAGGKATFPTDVIFLGAMNPCPCGYLGHPDKPCRDTQAQVLNYRRKISGPLLDRIDLHLEIPPVPYRELMNTQTEESSDQIRTRVIAARERLAQYTLPLHSSCQSLIKEAIDIMGLSARACKRLLRVAQTIAALDKQDCIQEHHLLEALSYRLQ